MPRPSHPALALALVLLAAGCGSARPVTPLGRGNTALGASVGGPLLQALGASFPTPILEVGAAHGLGDRTAVYGQIDVTAALYGTAHLEPGLAFHPVVREAGALPSLTLTTSVHVLADTQSALFAPHAGGIAWWRLGRHVVYAGADAAVPLRAPVRLLAGPLAGGQLTLGRASVGLELKWLAPHYDVGPLAPSWIAPGDRGYLTVLLGASYRLGGAP